VRALFLAKDATLGVVDDPRIAAIERDKLVLEVGPSPEQGDPLPVLERDSSLSGLVMEMYVGWPGRHHLALARTVLAAGRRVWLYWPDEQAVESVDRERIASLWRHWLFIVGYQSQHRFIAGLSRARARAGSIARAVRQVWRSTPKRQLPSAVIRKVVRALEPQLDAGPRPPVSRLPEQARLEVLDRLVAAPVPLAPPSHDPDRAHPIPGLGVYLRTDFWARIDSGGSYGHTCYVARELASVTDRFVCFMAHRYGLLDDFGLQQVVIDPPGAGASEDDIVSATTHYYHALKPAMEALRPAYIYERLCLGNYAGALLSYTLQIPYIAEYNGSEISMRRSFDGTGYVYEKEYLLAEAFAFKQATMISVVSDEVRATLIARGVDPGKILVNPNGADLTAYAPADTQEKAHVRAELGLPRACPVVVGFTGTFGGWHGVDVLAAAIPLICERAPEVSFLLIGDGNYKPLVDDAVAQHGLADRVRRVGRVPQSEGARLLKACDVYVSPHNSHMVDSRFFGSPTKIFEYMAMGGAIVASDLEQIGKSLSPALRVSDLKQPRVEVKDERAVLCTPGDVNEFVDAVVAIAGRPDLWTALGRNSRQAVERYYSWQNHVAHLWRFLAQPACAGAGAVAAGGVAASGSGRPAVQTGQVYKDEVQRQWDNDPAGSHYVKKASPHTLEWFLEAEAYRYGEYAPWMHETMEFERHSGERVLEIGGGMGTDLAQFARHGALVTDLDLSSGHLELAKENFRLRGLSGEFVLHDAETLVFDDNMFDLVYSNGVLHHTPNTREVVREIFRVLKPGGRAIVMMYAENSLHYWRNLVWAIGLKDHELDRCSMGEIMSGAVERSDNASARPLVKVYTKRRLRRLFDGFVEMGIVQRQMVPDEVPRLLARVPVGTLGTIMGWNLIIKARKPLR
jgi:glycosyltransferase involved in cell wall biosynthesis/ubiquinone/menaquinone biosynthesis C-methylase UbiE